MSSMNLQCASCESKGHQEAACTQTYNRWMMLSGDLRSLCSVFCTRISISISDKTDVNVILRFLYKLLNSNFKHTCYVAQQLRQPVNRPFIRLQLEQIYQPQQRDTSPTNNSTWIVTSPCFCLQPLPQAQILLSVNASLTRSMLL